MESQKTSEALKWSHPDAELYIPDGQPAEAALKRTTHLGIGAHPDDLEFMAWKGILDCRGNANQWFTGVTVTDGGGYARDAQSAKLSTEEICRIRRGEQNKAAALGEYGAMANLGFTSDEIKSRHPGIQEDLKQILRLAAPKTVFTHNPADKHDTHVALCVAVVEAIRALPAAERPEALYGCEVWRGLDWMPDEQKVAFDVSGEEKFMSSLMAVYASQLRGKRYDSATLGRKHANATYHTSHSSDRCNAMEYAMDLTPLIRNDRLSVQEYATGIVRKFEADVAARIAKYSH